MVLASPFESNGTGHAWVEVYGPGQIAGNDWFSSEPQGPWASTRKDYFAEFENAFTEAIMGKPDSTPFSFGGYAAKQNYARGKITRSPDAKANDRSLLVLQRNLHRNQIEKQG